MCKSLSQRKKTEMKHNYDEKQYRLVKLEF